MRAIIVGLIALFSVSGWAGPKCADDIIRLGEPMIIAQKACHDLGPLWRAGRIKDGMCRQAWDAGFANMGPFLIALSNKECRGKCRASDMSCWHKL